MKIKKNASIKWKSKKKLKSVKSMKTKEKV